MTTRSWLYRFISILLVTTLCTAPLMACGRSEPPPAVDDTQLARADTKPGMSTRKKVVLLAGAAALYYLYKRHQNAAAEAGPDSQYYLSKNGRVYYRDAEHRAHWVSPPSEGITVPTDQAQEYSQFQGYDGQSTGRDLQGLGTADAE